MAAIAGIGARLTGNTAGWTAALNQAQQAGREYVAATQRAMAAATSAVATATQQTTRYMSQQDAAMQRSAAVAADSARARATAERGASGSARAGTAARGAGGSARAGTAARSGSESSGGNLGHKAGVAYNFAQDYLQGGGIRGVANNIPQILQMVGKNTAMVGGALVATAFSLYGFAKSLKYFSEAVGFTSGQTEADKKRRDDEAYQRSFLISRTGMKRSISSGQEGGRAVAVENASVAEKQFTAFGKFDTRIANEKAVADAVAENQRARIQGIEDLEKRAKASADFELAEINRIDAWQKSVARDRLQMAQDLLDMHQANKDRIDAEIASIDENAAKSDFALAERLAKAREELVVAKEIYETAKRTRDLATQDVDSANAATKVSDVRKQGVMQNERLQMEEAAKKKGDQNGEAVLKVFDTIAEGIRRVEEAGKEYVRQQGIDQGKQAILREIAIQELRSRGDNKRAEELEKAAMREQRIEQLQKANFTKEEATALADREAAASKRRGTGRFGKRIQGAKSKNRASGIDGEALTDAFDFDAFQAEGIPGFKEATTQKKKIQGAGKKDAQNTKPPTEKEGTGTQRIEALLADLINVTKGRKSK